MPALNTTAFIVPMITVDLEDCTECLFYGPRQYADPVCRLWRAARDAGAMSHEAPELPGHPGPAPAGCPLRSKFVTIVCGLQSMPEREEE